MQYERAKRAGPGLLCVTCLLSFALTGCSEGWERFWEWKAQQHDTPGDGDGDGDGNADGGAAGSGAIDAGGSSDAGGERACGAGPDATFCEEGEYCRYEADAACGRTGEPGVCVPIPEVCTLELNPVCGCDGLTYDNPCAAAQARVSIEHEGECPTRICGGYAGIKCFEDEYCDLAEGQGCDVADASGVCKPRPRVCTREYNPVCGCNDLTYGNPCLAAADGMTVRAPGECGPVP